MDARKNNLFAAISEKKIDELKKIEAEGIDLTWTNDDDKTPVEAATIKRWTEGVKLLAKKPADKNDGQLNSARYGSALYYAIEAQLPDLVEYLLELKPSLGWANRINKDGLLHIAIRTKNIDIFKLLIKTEINLLCENTDKKTPLTLALSLQQWEYAEMLFDAKPNQVMDKKEGSKYLLNAIKDKQHRLIKLLLQAGVSVSATTEIDKDSCLHLAVKNNDVTALKLLLDTPIDKSLRNKEYKTPVELACELSHWVCAQAIIEKDLKNIDSLNETYLEELHYIQALHLGIKKGNFTIVNLLLKLNISCMKEDVEKGNIAIYYACTINNKAILALLLQKIDLKKVNTNKDNKTPFDIAKELHATECYSLLNQNVFKPTEKNAELVDVCEIYLRNLELTISLTVFNKVKPLLGKWIDPPPIDSINNILSKINYHDRKHVWDSFIKIAGFFKSYPTTDFNLAQLKEITEILELSKQQYTQTKNQVANKIMNTNAPYYSDIQLSLPLPSYEQAVTRSTLQPLIPPPPPYSLLATAAVQPNSSAIPKEMKPLPNVSYSALADLSMFQNSSSASLTNNPFTTVTTQTNSLIPPPTGM